MNPQLILLTDPARFAAAGIPWTTTHQARWAFRRRHENGLAGAFKRIGTTIAIDVPKFHELVGRNNA